MFKNNPNSGGHRTPANDQEKWTFEFHGLVCTIAVSFGNLSFFSRWPPYWKAFQIALKILLISQDIRIVGCSFFYYFIPFCVTSIYAEWHIAIASSSNFVASSSVVCIVVCHRHTVFRTVSQKQLVRFNSNLACGCNWSWGCAV